MVAGCQSEHRHGRASTESQQCLNSEVQALRHLAPTVFAHISTDFYRIWFVFGFCIITMIFSLKPTAYLKGHVSLVL